MKTHSKAFFALPLLFGCAAVAQPGVPPPPPIVLGQPAEGAVLSPAPNAVFTFTVGANVILQKIEFSAPGGYLGYGLTAKQPSFSIARSTLQATFGSSKVTWTVVGKIPNLPPNVPPPLAHPRVSRHFFLVSPPPDLAVTVDPDYNTVWPTKFVVTNVGDGKSEDTLLRIKVDLLQADNEIVVKNCVPRFDDFDEVVSELTHGQHKDVKVPVTLELPKWRRKIGRGGRVSPTPKVLLQQPTPTPTPNPVQQIVACQFKVTAELASNHNVKDSHKANNKLERTIKMDVPLKP